MLQMISIKSFVTHRFRNPSLDRLSSLLHSATSTFDVNEVEHIHYIAFDKNAGLSQQQAHAKR